MTQSNEEIIDRIDRATEDMWPPHGYINKADWQDVYNRCDPNDRPRPVMAHFVPHVEYQLPEMFKVISFEEHTAILQAKDLQIKEIEGNLVEWQDNVLRQKSKIIQLKCELASLKNLCERLEKKLREPIGGEKNE